MGSIKRETKTMILREIFYFLSLILFLGSTSFLVAISTPPSTSHADTKAVQPDNSKVNRRDAAGTTLTPEDQYKGSSRDVETTRRIRESLIRDTSLSANAKNVKIITLKGITTLRGPVNSIEESLFIERVAKNINGASVDNKLEVVSK
jgi:osmotically-inducible protein OsmY